ncbi:NosD domain-containing protein [Halorussus litoreus]|uniref:NosD domain-containing protein n=1 Tax=Halorussus litoreus TaxID=1710536 RepID=UPI000E24DB2D|nr:NosD domain-containing protein [Halorussus litoreus]
MRRSVAAALVVLVAGAYVGPFTVDATPSPEPVAFDHTVRVGLPVETVRTAQSGGHVVPRVEVFYAQYDRVVGHYGVASFVETSRRPGHTARFGPPLAVYVSDFAGTDPRLTDGLFVNASGDPGWVRAAEARFVVARAGDGTRVVPFGDPAAARSFARQVDGTVRDWGSVLETVSGRESYDYDSRVERRHASADRTVATLRPLLDRPVSVVVGEDAPTVAAAVEQAPPNTTVVVPGGVYRTRVRVDKPLTLRGAGPNATVFDGGGDGTVVSVDAPRVAVTDLAVEGVGTQTIDADATTTGWDSSVERTYGRGDAGVAVLNVSSVLVDDVMVETPSNGVLVRDADRTAVTNVTVRGNPVQTEGYMGVMAMRSSVVVQDSTFVDGRDGVYAHRADGLVVRNSTMRDLRFGVHLMYTSGSLLAGNRVLDADTGLVIMTRPADNAVVGNDVRRSNHGIVTAGADSYVARNVLADNGVGLKIGSRTSLYEHNALVGNEVGAEASSFVASNRVVRNDFVDNARAVRDGAGQLRVWSANGSGNYWDDAVGVGQDGGLDRPYRPTGPADRDLRRPGALAVARSPVAVSLRALRGAVPGMRDRGVLDRTPSATPHNPVLLRRAEATHAT